MDLVKRRQEAQALVEKRKKDLLALVSNDKRKFEQYKAVMVELSQNHNLARCSIESVILTATRIIQLGLNPNPLLSEAYVVPRGIFKYDPQARKKVKIGEEAELQIGTKGYKILAYRAGWNLAHQSVYACDKFTAVLGEMIPKYTLVPNEEQRQEDDGNWVFQNLKGIIVFAEDPRGKIHKAYIKRSKLEKIRLKSSTQKFEPNKLTGIWFEWAEEMYAKSALKYFVKRLPIDSFVMEAIIQDEEGERDEVTADNAIEAEVITVNTSPALKRGADIAGAVKSMGLSLYYFEGRAVVEGNTFQHAKMLQELGFVCEDNEWYFAFDNKKDLALALLPGIKIEEKDGFLAIRGKQAPEIEVVLLEIGFAWFDSKKLYVCKAAENRAA